MKSSSFAWLSGEARAPYPPRLIVAGFTPSRSGQVCFRRDPKERLVDTADAIVRAIIIIKQNGDDGEGGGGAGDKPERDLKLTLSPGPNAGG